MSNCSNRNGIIILAGGKSQRMGTAKANLPFASTTVLQYMVNNMVSVSKCLVVVCASPEKRPIVQGRIHWAYDGEAGQGPLRGLEAGLMALPSQVDQVFVTSCDAPVLQPDLVSWLFSEQAGEQALVPQIADFAQPLVGVYKTNILTAVTGLLKAGKRSLQGLLACVDTRLVPEHQVRAVDPKLLSFENINTPEDYQRVLGIFSKMD